MANKGGIKWNKGGSTARKQMISIDFSNFAEFNRPTCFCDFRVDPKIDRNSGKNCAIYCR